MLRGKKMSKEQYTSKPMYEAHTLAEIKRKGLFEAPKAYEPGLTLGQCQDLYLVEQGKR